MDILRDFLTYIIPVAVVVILLIILAMGYVKAPPDRAKADTYDAKVTRNLNISGLPNTEEASGQPSEN